jgi:microcystin-dependent protein
MARALVTKTSSIVGEVKAFAGLTAPQGYLICDGSAVSRSQYANLFDVIGTSHGQGDGSTTFNLPDYRGQFLRGRIAIPNVTGTGSAASNQATFTNHGFNRTGLRVRLASGALTGLALNTDYFVIVVDANTLAFATSRANALANTRIVISGVNTAVITQWVAPDTTARLASNVGGNSGNGVGSIEEESFGNHDHPFFNNGSASMAFPGSLAGDPRYKTIDINENVGTHTSGIANVGGNETRPTNVSVNYIIKV